MSNKNIIPYKYPVKDINYVKPEAHEKAYKNTITEINNAWNKTTFLDDYGAIWVSAEKIHSILRTSKGNGRYHIGKMNADEIINRGNTIYIKGSKLGAMIDDAIQDSGGGTKEKYLRYSEELYKAIRDSETAKNLRLEFSKELDKKRKGLKKKRIKKYKIKFDELTGEELIGNEVEFSHIRSFAIFPKLGDNIENGLIINKSSHDIITNEAVNDEEELYSLCKENKWDVSWYDKFKQYFNIEENY